MSAPFDLLGHLAARLRAAQRAAERAEAGGSAEAADKARARLVNAWTAHAVASELIAATRNKRNADCGLPKSCGHAFDCVCAGTRLDAALVAAGVQS